MTDEERAAWYFMQTNRRAHYGNKKRRKPHSRGDWVWYTRFCWDYWPDNRRKIRDKIHAQEMIYYDLD